MAFMIPVMKNNYEIYNGGRSRKISESSATECQSLSTSPGIDYVSSSHRNHMQRSYSSKPFPRNHSKTSEDSFGISPTYLSLQASCNPTDPPKSVTLQSSRNSLARKFNTRVMVEKLRTLSLFRKENSTERS
ncbi:uncharacterized protein LOC129616776 [Condylostylus longicornis]|uniref:uncharacterized protein LOC129616776 n=1 Tax=Condylostylus longicornis TaxID=2530218 RepID=UPI00244DB059|nr:uncharacterized protein LOC129616776 [Condylostylus longicornis]